MKKRMKESSHASPPSVRQPDATSPVREGTSARVLVAVATYNEIENLPIFVRRLKDTLPEVDLLVIDDGSPDGTGQWCDEQQATDERLVCSHRQGKLGLGSAIVAAMQFAIDHGYDILVNLDADLSHPPEKIPQLLAAVHEHGPATTVAFGSRYAPGGGIEGWPLRRHLMSRAINLYARTLLRLPVSDCSGSFRAYPVALLRQIDFDTFESRGYSFFEEILLRLKQVGAGFVEVPFTFVERRYGRSKINLREARRAVWIIFRLGLKVWLSPR